MDTKYQQLADTAAAIAHSAFYNTRHAVASLPEPGLYAYMENRHRASPEAQRERDELLNQLPEELSAEILATGMAAGGFTMSIVFKSEDTKAVEEFTREVDRDPDGMKSVLSFLPSHVASPWLPL